MDAVVTFYNEDTTAIQTTLEALLRQETPFSTIFLVDDGSTDPVTTDLFGMYPNVEWVRNEVNMGISFSRNRVIQLSSAGYIACINIDVILHPRWTTELIRLLEQDPGIGSVFSRMEPEKNTLLSAWRFRFHEQKYNLPSGEVKFAPGHAVLFRRSELLSAGAYNNALKRVGEDYDISLRMQKAGLITWYCNKPLSVSIQQDTLANLSRKQMVRITGNSLETMTWNVFFRRSFRIFFATLMRNLGKGRLFFLPIDVIVFVRGFYFFRKEQEKLRLNNHTTISRLR